MTKTYEYTQDGSIIWREQLDADTVTISRPFAPNSEDFNQIVSEGVEIAPYVEPVKSLNDIRSERGSLLRKHVDIYNPIRWADLTAAQKDKVKVYRKALLDITVQDPSNVVWPEPPTI